MPGKQPKDKHFVHDGLVNGRPTRVKFCPGCQRDLPVNYEKPKLAAFSPMRADGVLKSWRRLCKQCERVDRKRRWDALPEEEKQRRVELRARTNKVRYDRIRADPEAWADRLDQMKGARKRWWRNLPADHPIKAENARKCREWAEAKLAENPDYFTAAKERERKAARDARTISIVPSEPFRRYAEAYGELLGTKEAGTIAKALGIEARRMWAVMHGEGEHVSTDVVDTALLNASYVVDVQINGDPVKTSVFGIDDLYPNVNLDVSPTAARNGVELYVSHE